MESGVELNPSAEQCGALRQQVAASLERSRRQKNKLKATDRHFSIASLVLGAIATFIAGQSAISECTAQLKVLALETAADVYDVELAKDTYQRIIAEFSKLDF